MKRITILLFVNLVSVCAAMGQQLPTTLPLIKGTSGDTTVHVTEPFSIYTRTYTPSDTVIVFWEQASNSFSVYGQAISLIASEAFRFSFGIAGNSLLQLDADRAATVFLPAVLDTFVFAGQAFIGNDSTAHYRYDTATQVEQIYGAVEIVIDGKRTPARLGSSDDPGVDFAGDEVHEVWVHLKDSVNLRGLKAFSQIGTDIILKHRSSDPANIYYGHGTWIVDLLETIQVATLGTNSDPGIVMSDGHVDSVEMVVAGGLLFGMLPVADLFTVKYVHSVQKYAINGYITFGIPIGALAKAVGLRPSLQIFAGDDDTPGFLLNLETGKFEVEDATFLLKHVGTDQKVELGGFELTNLAIRVQDNVPDSFELRVLIPPGISLDGNMGYEYNPAAPLLERFQVNSIGFTWEAKHLDDAIPIGETGANLVKFGGEISNLQHPNDLTADGDIGITLGSSFDTGIPGFDNVVLGYMEAFGSVSPHGMEFGVTGLLGAKFASGMWEGIFGDLAVDLDISWGHASSFTGSVTLLTPPNDFINAELVTHFNSHGDIDALGDVSLTVPNYIPIVGGRHFSIAKGAIRGRGLEPGKSYGAGWIKFDLGFDHTIAGIKTSLHNGHISKIGTKEAKAITKQVAADGAPPPPGGPDDPPSFLYFECSVNHLFTLETDKPPAYLQAQFSINNSASFFNESYGFYGTPFSGNMLSPNGDDLTFYTSDGATDVSNDGSFSYLGNNRVQTHDVGDTLRWIIANSGADSYGSIDWVNQPDVLLTPGEYVFNFGGYCSVDVPALSEDDFSIDISPVFPRPTIDFSIDQSNAINISYSSYLTDSTLISVYWNTNNAQGGHALLHHNYYDGTAQGDSSYLLTIKDWDPGILTQSRIYVYVVIDDFVNAPVYSAIDSTDYFENLQNISGLVLNGADSTVVVLRPADTTRSDVIALPTFMSSEGMTFDYYNIPPGDYSLLCFSHDTIFNFTTNLQFDNLDGDYRLVYHSPEWVSAKFNAASWLNGIAQVTFHLEQEEVQLYGSVSDTTFAPIDGVKLHVLDTTDVLIQTISLDESNYIVTGLDTGQYVKLAVVLPSDNTYHWPSVRQQEYLSNIESAIVQTTPHLQVDGTPKATIFQAHPGPQGLVFMALLGDNSGPPLPGTVVNLQLQDGTGTSLHAVTNEYGLAFFPAEELEVNTWYVYDVSWPPGYEGPEDPANTHFWQGEIFPVRIFGMQE